MKIYYLRYVNNFYNIIMSTSSQSTSNSTQFTQNSTPSSFQLNTSMDIDSGDTKIYTPSYLSPNYNTIVFPKNLHTYSNSRSSSTNSVSTNSQFSE